MSVNPMVNVINKMGDAYEAKIAKLTAALATAEEALLSCGDNRHMDVQWHSIAKVNKALAAIKKARGKV